MKITTVALNRGPRELTEQEKQIMVINQMCCHLFIRTLDQLQQTSIYRHKVKLLVRQLMIELEKHADLVDWSGDTVDAAVEQMEHGARNVEYLMQMMIKLGGEHESSWPLFFADMNQVFKRFDMNLKVDHEGHLHAFDVAGVPMLML